MQPAQPTPAANGQANTKTVNPSRGAPNPHQGAFNQSHYGHNLHDGLVQQPLQADESGISNVNNGFVEQNHQVNNFAYNFATSNQIGASQSHTLNAAVDQNQVFFDRLQTQADFNATNGWENFDVAGINGAENPNFNMDFHMNFNMALDDAISPDLPAEFLNMDFSQYLHDQEQPATQEQQPAIQLQQPFTQVQQPATHEQQSSQEQTSQQQSTQGESLEQDLNNDLFGDEEDAANLQPLVNFLAEN